MDFMKVCSLQRNIYVKSNSYRRGAREEEGGRGVMKLHPRGRVSGEGELEKSGQGSGTYKLRLED